MPLPNTTGLTKRNPITETFFKGHVGNIPLGGAQAKIQMTQAVMDRERRAQQAGLRQMAGAYEGIVSDIGAYSAQAGSLYEELEKKLTETYGTGFEETKAAIGTGFKAARGELEKGIPEIEDMIEEITRIHADLIEGIDSYVAETGITDPRHRINSIRGAVESAMSNWIGNIMPDIEARTGGRLSVPSTRQSMKDLFQSIVQMYPEQIQAAEQAGMNVLAMKQNLGTWAGGQKENLLDRKLGVREGVAGLYAGEAREVGEASRFKTAGIATGTREATAGRVGVMSEALGLTIGAKEKIAGIRGQLAAPTDYDPLYKAIQSIPYPQSKQLPATTRNPVFRIGQPTSNILQPQAGTMGSRDIFGRSLENVLSPLRNVTPQKKQTTSLSMLR